jgi:hypothetical protein
LITPSSVGDAVGVADALAVGVADVDALAEGVAFDVLVGVGVGVGLGFVGHSRHDATEADPAAAVADATGSWQATSANARAAMIRERRCMWVRLRPGEAGLETPNLNRATTGALPGAQAAKYSRSKTVLLYEAIV